MGLGRREWIRRAWVIVAAPALFAGLEALDGPGGPPFAAGEESPPGVPATTAVAEEIRLALARAVDRFQAKDLGGVLGYVSEQYWTGPFTKPVLRAQLATIFRVHRQVRAAIRIDDIRLVGPHAWVYTTGDVSGEVAIVGGWVSLFSWENELEVARREGSGWRLYGYQA